jgi:hypothetical protein
MDPTSSADVQRSSKAASTVVPTIVIISNLRFMQHHDRDGHLSNRADRHLFEYVLRPAPLVEIFGIGSRTEPYVPPPVRI